MKPNKVYVIEMLERIKDFPSGDYIECSHVIGVCGTKEAAKKLINKPIETDGEVIFEELKKDGWYKTYNIEHKDKCQVTMHIFATEEEVIYDE